MKTYDETVSAVFDRINDYNVKKKRRTALACRVTAACCAVSLLGGSVWYLNRPTHDIPVTPATDDDTVTTTITTAPTEQESTTTTVDTPTTNTTTDGGVVTPPTTVTTVATTTASTKTEAPQTTTTTVKEKLLITGDAFDYEVFDESASDSLSFALKEKMEAHKGVDAEYAVIVLIPFIPQDSSIDDDFWASTEELAQFHKEYYEVYYAYREEAERLNPTWDGHSGKTIEVWTDTLRANYERWLTLIEEKRNIQQEYKIPYAQACWNKRYETFKSLCTSEPIDILCETNSVLGLPYHAYYVELTADALNTLGKQKGYWVTLSTGDYQIILDE